jgi:hypothetical protein
MRGWVRWVIGGLLLLVGLTGLVGAIVWAPLREVVKEATIVLALGLGALCGLDAMFHRWLNSAPDCGARVRQVLKAVADDPRFQQDAGLVDEEQGAANPDLAAFQQALAQAEVCYSPIWQGGFADHVPGRGYVLALSPVHLRAAAAAHELFHLARHIRGVTPFEQPRALDEVVLEEMIVWALTVRYMPVRGTIELLVPLTVLGTGVWLVLTALSWVR